MRKLLIIALAAAMLSTASTALAQRIDTAVTSTTYVGDEPNTGAGILPYNFENSPSAKYPADDNNLGSARTESFATILSVDWTNRPAVNGPRVATNTLLERMTGNGFMVPGYGQWVAWYGAFQDADQDGYIDDGNEFYDRVHVNTQGDCTTAVSTTDDHGVGETLPTGEATDTHVTARCESFDEWEPPAENALIVAYVTPSAPSDVVNRWFGAWNPLSPPPPQGQEEPDFTFQGIGAELSTPTGMYYSPGTNFDYLTVDDGILHTVVIEAISDPKTVTDGPRTHEVETGSLVEVDLFSSVDPAVEGLYQQNIRGPLVTAGCNVDYPERGCRATTDQFTEKVRKFDETLAPTVGSETQNVFVGWERDPQDYDRSTKHLFLDLVAHTSLAVGAAVHFNDNNILASYSEYTNAELSPTADGKTHAWPQLAILGYFGIWEDKNGDGWIGEPTTAPGCPDVHDCGNDPMPHDYPQHGKDDKEEFTVACGDKSGGGGQQVDGSFVVTLVPQGGKWGNAGVYLLTDRKDVRNSNWDNLERDGRSPFIPYDDIAFDAADDGELDQTLVTSGNIEFHMICRSQSGFYASYERIVFPEGTNLGYDIAYAGGTTGSFTDKGVPAGETAADADVIAATTL